MAGKIAIKRNRFVDLKAPKKQVNWALLEKNRALAGVKGYQTSRVDLTAEQGVDLADVGVVGHGVVGVVEFVEVRQRCLAFQHGGDDLVDLATHPRHEFGGPADVPGGRTVGGKSDRSSTATTLSPAPTA